MTSSRSQRALIAFAVLAIPFAVWQCLDWSVRPVFTVLEGTDGVADLRSRRALKPGLSVGEQGQVHTRLSPTRLQYEATEIWMDQKTDITIKTIHANEIRLFSTRGHARLTPDRELTYCTRATCTKTASPLELFYYTPGEVVEIRPSGPALVTFQDTEYPLTANKTLVIDELTHLVQIR